MIEGLYRIFILEPRRGLSLMSTVIRIAGGYLIVGIAFVIFVIANKGIVVGDRSSHAATFHPIQVLYFVAFTSGFTAPYVLTKSKVTAFWNFCRKHWIFVGFATLVIMSVVDSFGSLAHPYLLADNR